MDCFSCLVVCCICTTDNCLSQVCHFSGIFSNSNAKECINVSLATEMQMYYVRIVWKLRIACVSSQLPVHAGPPVAGSFFMLVSLQSPGMGLSCPCRLDVGAWSTDKQGVVRSSRISFLRLSDGRGVITETNIWSGLLKGSPPRWLAYTKQQRLYVPFHHHGILGCVHVKGNE